jgi:hypothetical protein
MKNRILSNRTLKARQNYHCFHCKELINKNENYLRVAAIENYRFVSANFHIKCDKKDLTP